MEALERRGQAGWTCIAEAEPTFSSEIDTLSVRSRALGWIAWCTAGVEVQAMVSASVSRSGRGFKPNSIRAAESSNRVSRRMISTPHRLAVAGGRRSAKLTDRWTTTSASGEVAGRTTYESWDTSPLDTER